MLNTCTYYNLKQLYTPIPKLKALKVLLSVPNVPTGSRARIDQAFLFINMIKVDVLFAFNTFHAAGKCRRQVKHLTNYVNFFKIVEFHEHIWNHYEKYIEISTNMPAIGSLIR